MLETRTPNPEPRTSAPADSTNLKDKFLAEIRSGKATLYNTVVAQAQRIDVTSDRITFVFGPAQSMLRSWLDQQKAWLDAAAERIAGRKIAVTSEVSSAPSAESRQAAPGAAAPESGSQSSNPGQDKRDLKAEAMASTAVQAILEVFPAEIRDVEEM